MTEDDPFTDSGPWVDITGPDEDYDLVALHPAADDTTLAPEEQHSRWPWGRKWSRKAKSGGIV